MDNSDGDDDGDEDDDDDGGNKGGDEETMEQLSTPANRCHQGGNRMTFFPPLRNA